MSAEAVGSTGGSPHSAWWPAGALIGVLAVIVGPAAVAADHSHAAAVEASAAPKPEPEPVEVSLTVHLDAPVGMGGPKAPIYLRITALGSVFPGSVTLRDDAGVNVATARAIFPASRCPIPARVAVRDLTPGRSGSRQEWCVKVSGLEVGSEVTGTLNGHATVLKLTLGVRHNFFWLPFLVTLIGGAVAVGAALVARWLRRYLRDTHIDMLVQRNRRSRDRRIAGLAGWVARMRSRRLPDEELSSLVERLVESGPERIRAARSSLDEALRTTRVPSAPPLYGLARREADRLDYTVNDFVDAVGKEKTILLPDRWVSSLEEAVRLAEEIEEAEQEAARLPSSVNEELLRSLEVMRGQWLRAGDQNDLEELDQALEDFQPRLRRALEREVVAERRTIREPLLAPAGAAPPRDSPLTPRRRGRPLVAVALGGVILLGVGVTFSMFLVQPEEEAASPVPPLATGSPPPPLATVGESPEGAFGAPPPPAAPPELTPAEATEAPSPAVAPEEPSAPGVPVLPVLLGAVALVVVFVPISLAWGRAGLAIGITVGLIILAAAVFIVAVAVSAYAPNPLFGRLSDYLTLATASTSSGALGGILGVLAYWRATGQGNR